MIFSVKWSLNFFRKSDFITDLFISVINSLVNPPENKKNIMEPSWTSLELDKCYSIWLLFFNLMVHKRMNEEI